MTTTVTTATGQQRKNVWKSETMKNYTRTVVDIIKKVIYLYINANVLGKLNQDKEYVPKILSLFVMLLHYRSHFLLGVRAILLRQSGKQRDGGDDNCMMLLHFGNKPSLPIWLFHSSIPFALIAATASVPVYYSLCVSMLTYCTSTRIANPICITLISRFHSSSPESDPIPICIPWFAGWQLLFGIIFSRFFFNLNFRHKIIFKDDDDEFGTA